MLRCFVKNSFLALEDAFEIEAPARRSRSADAPSAVLKLDRRSEAVVARLNDVLSGRLQLQPEQPEGPSVDELRRLQKMLSEATGKMPLENRRVLSSSSVSTMASQCDDHTLRSAMPHVWSTGSVSTMVSDFWEETYEDGGAEFGPIVEEDARLDEADTPTTQWQQPAGPTANVQSDLWLGHLTNAKVPTCFAAPADFSEPGDDAAQGPPTTMMIRNIPNRYTQRELVKELEGLGFAGSFDFLYVPMDKVTMCNVGYAFVNFIDPMWALRCMELLENYAFKKHRRARGKIAAVSVAYIQGLQANLRHYQSATIGSATRFKQRCPVILASAAKCRWQK